MGHASFARVSIVRWILLPLVSLVLVSCGGGGDDSSADNQVVCLNCSGLSGNARLNCESQNASRKGC